MKTTRFSPSIIHITLETSGSGGLSRDICQQLLFSPQDCCLQHIFWYPWGPLGRGGGVGGLALYLTQLLAFARLPPAQSCPATLPQNSISLFTWVNVGQIIAQHVEQ